MEIHINSDKGFVKMMRKKIKENGGYCPCSVVQTDDTKCMCKKFLEQESGGCKCGLYTKVAESKDA